MTRVTAQLNFLHMAPRKVRAVADLLRGRAVNEAEAELVLQRRRAAKPLLKLLRSAIANAKQRQMNVADLTISEIRVDQGPMLKRFLPRARGMATPIQKKMSNVRIVLSGVEVKVPSAEGRADHRAPRFTIIIKRKSKKTSASHHSKQHKEKPMTPSAGGSPRRTEKPGFWKRMFRRKSV